MSNTHSADIRLLPAPGYVDVRFHGEVDLAALLAASRRISDHPGFRRGMHTLADSAAAAPRLDYMEIDRFRDYTQSIEALRGDCRWAAVAVRSSSRESISLLAAMASAFKPRIRVRHFYSSEEALDWLRT